MNLSPGSGSSVAVFVGACFSCAPATGASDTRLINIAKEHLISASLSRAGTEIIMQPRRVPVDYTAVGGPNHLPSVSTSPICICPPTQATYPSGRINTAVGAVTGPSAGSSQVPGY